MKAQSILYINHYAGSPRHGMEFRPYYLARSWVDLGHRVRILAASFSHLRKHNPCVSRCGQLQEDIDGIDYRFFSTPSYTGNGFGRLRNIAAFLRHLGRNASTVAREFRPTAVIASSTYPMDARIAYHIARTANAPLIFEVHDIWPLTLTELHGLPHCHPFVVWCKYAEQFAYRNSNRVVSLLPAANEYMIRNGMNRGNFTYIPNGVHIDTSTNDVEFLPTLLRHALERARSARDVIVAYTGYHGQANALEYLLSAAHALRDRKVVFFLVGDGPCKKTLQRSATESGLSNLFFFDSMSRLQVLNLLGQCDIAYLGWRDHSLYRFGISPNKLMDYMLSSLPVVHSVNAANDPVGKSNCGISVLPEDPERIACAILELVSKTPAERMAIGRRGREYVLRNHSYPVLAQKYLQILTGTNNI